MATKIEPNITVMKKFKKFIHGTKITNFQTYSRKKEIEHKSANYTGVLTTTIIGKLVIANQKGLEVAMMINDSDGNGRSASAVTKINALFVDFDKSTMTVKALLALSIKPHLIVNSSPKKFHAYWLITDCDVDQFTPVMNALADKLGSDPSVSDKVRVMRMPGTINWKYPKPFLAKIIEIQEEAKPIPLKVFIKKMQINIDEKHKSVNKVANQPVKLTKEMVVKIREELKHLSADDRKVWQKIGMAIHSADKSERGYKIWTEWSEKSDKFDEDQQHQRWSQFKPDKGITLDSLFWLTSHAKISGDKAVDEMVLADYFADKFKQQLRYDRDIKNWYQFDGVVWKIDAQSPIRLARQMVLELSSVGNDSYKRFRSAGALKGIVNHAELVDDLQINQNQFDVNQKFFAVKNGVINLRSGIFRSATASDYLRRYADVVFDGRAKCPELLIGVQYFPD